MTLPPSRLLPWVMLDRGEPVDYQILQVRHATVADPRDGSRHPRVQLDAPDWVNVIPVTPEGNVVLVRQFRCGVWSSTLEIPGGMVDPGEDPATAAHRELEEETGYRASRVVPLGVCHPNPALQGNRQHCFLAEGCQRLAEPSPDAGEDIEVELVNRQQLDRLIRNGDITHALVLAAFLFERLRDPRSVP